MTTTPVTTPTDTRPISNRPARERFTGLDGLRAVGIIAVFLTHNAFATGTTNGGRFTAQVGPISGRSVLGYLEVGATIFFVISAFLLYRPFVTAAFNDTPAPSPAGFLRRRFIRIFPAYWATLALLFALGWIHTATPLHTIRVITLTHVYTQQGFYAIDILVPTWTLATEAAFYVFLVLWAPLMRQVGRGCEPRARLQRELIGATALAAFRVRIPLARVPRCGGTSERRRALAPGHARSVRGRDGLRGDRCLHAYPARPLAAPVATARRPVRARRCALVRRRDVHARE